MKAGEGNGDPKDQPTVEAGEFAESGFLVDLFEKGLEFLLGNFGGDLSGSARESCRQLSVFRLPIFTHFHMHLPLKI